MTPTSTWTTTPTMASKWVSLSSIFLSLYCFLLLWTWFLLFLQVFKFQLFSLTSVPPDDQKVRNSPLSLSDICFFCIYLSLWSYICVKLWDEFVYHFDRLSELTMIGQSPPIPISPPSRRSSDWFRSMKKSRKWKIKNPAAEMTLNCWNPTRNWLGCCRFGDCYCHCF